MFSKNLITRKYLAGGEKIINAFVQGYTQNLRSGGGGQRH